MKQHRAHIVPVKLCNLLTKKVYSVFILIDKVNKITNEQAVVHNI